MELFQFNFALIWILFWINRYIKFHIPFLFNIYKLLNKVISILFFYIKTLEFIFQGHMSLDK